MDKPPSAQQDVSAAATTKKPPVANGGRAPKFFSKKRGNGLTLAKAEEIISRAPEGVPELAQDGAGLLADSEIARSRKLKAAGEIGAIFLKTQGSLDRAAGTIRVRRWSEKWQAETEEAARAIVSAGERLDEALARWAEETGLLPLAGTLPALAGLLSLVEALLAVRGEDASLVAGEGAPKALARLRAAVALVENAGRHMERLSLNYPDAVIRDARLEEWLRLWNESEFWAAFPRWRARRKILRGLFALAAGTAGKTAPDPRIELGNLIAMRKCREEFAENFAEIPSAFPSFFEAEEDFSAARRRLDALERAQSGLAETFASLDSEPEKRAAWKLVIEHWVRGENREFLAGGNVERAFLALKKAQENFREKSDALALALEAELPEEAREFSAEAVNFAQKLLEDSAFWKSICEWNAQAFIAERRGMVSLVSAVREGSVPAGAAQTVFDVNYCRAWLAAVQQKGQTAATEGVLP